MSTWQAIIMTVLVLNVLVFSYCVKCLVFLSTESQICLLVFCRFLSSNSTVVTPIDIFIVLSYCGGIFLLDI